MNRRLYPLFIVNQVVGVVYLALNAYYFPALVYFELTGVVGIGEILAMLSVYALFIFNHFLLDWKVFREQS